MSAPRPSLAILLACSFAFIIVQLDVTIVNVALPRMGQELGVSVAGLQWVVDAYTLGFAVFLLSAGVLGDRYGAPRAFGCGYMLFAAASLACALAPDALALNLARAVQGIGAALLVPSSLSILNYVYAHDKPMLGRAVGWWTAAGGVSIAAGPVLGGLLLSMGGWRSVFWINLPVCLAGYWLTRRVVPPMPPQRPQPAFDYAGQVLAIAALASLTGTLISVHERGIGDAWIQAGIAVALLAGVGFVLAERATAAPMLQLALFRSAPFSGAVLFGVLVNFAYYGVIFVLSIYLQSVRHMSALQAGLTFLPLTGTFIFSNIASGRMSTRMGWRAPMIVGGLIGACGYALLCWLGVRDDSSLLQMLPGLVLIPAGMGLGVPAMTASILAGVARQQGGTASAVLNTARQVGGAAGVAVFGALAAGSDAARITHGVQLALVVSALLLLVAAGLALRCLAPPLPRTPEIRLH